MCENSSSLSLAGLFRMRSGMRALPTSMQQTAERQRGGSPPCPVSSSGRRRRTRADADRMLEGCSRRGSSTGPAAAASWLRKIDSTMPSTSGSTRSTSICWPSRMSSSMLRTILCASPSSRRARAASSLSSTWIGRSSFFWAISCRRRSSSALTSLWSRPSHRSAPLTVSM